MSKKPESTFMNMVLRLLIVVGVAGAVLGFVYIQTFDVIEAAKKKKLENAISKVVPSFDTLVIFSMKPETGKDSLIFYKAYSNDSLVGTAIKTYTEKGFSGVFRIMVGFDTKGCIISTAVLEHKETPGLGDKMDKKKSSWSNQFNGKNPDTYKLKVTKDGGDVDAITAATISSRAFCDATKRAYKSFKKEGEKSDE